MSWPAKRSVTNRAPAPTVPGVEKTKLTLGHSPDPDDAFMFYGLAKGLVDDGGYDFEHILQDIQTLNERASRGELDISAILALFFSAITQRTRLKMATYPALGGRPM